VRAQAVRAIADLADPVLAQHRLDAGRGDAVLAARLAALAGKDQDSRVMLEVVIALGRLRWPGIANWLRHSLSTEADAAVTHAAMQALRQSKNWPAFLPLLDAPDDDSLRFIALRAVGGQYDEELIDGLLGRLRRETHIVRLREYADCLARVYKKPGPWVYWGYRPDPRPANDVTWARTDAIGAALNDLLIRLGPLERLTMLHRMQREKIPANLNAVGTWLGEENDAERVAALLEYLRSQPAAEMHRYLEPVIRNPAQTSANRLTALSLFLTGLDEQHASALLVLSEQLEDGPVLAEALRAIGRYRQLSVAEILIRNLRSTNAAVRAAAAATIGDMQITEGQEPLVLLLADDEPEVRRAAAGAAGALKARQAIAPLVRLTVDSDPLVRAASLESLLRMQVPDVVSQAVAALNERQTAPSALKYLHEFGSPAQMNAVVESAKRNPTLEMLRDAVQVLTRWRGRPSISVREQEELDQAVAEIHGASGSLVRWAVSASPQTSTDKGEFPPASVDWQTAFALGTEGRVVVPVQAVGAGHLYHARTAIAVSNPTDVEWFVVSNGNVELWLNGTSLGHRQPSQGATDAQGIPATLVKGTNQLAVSIEAANASESQTEFSVRFRRKSAVVELERLARAAIARVGNPDQGREVFLNVEKSLCLKCHRLDGQGERTGPELTGLGSRFSRIYITESILEPSRAVSPHFATIVVRLENGQVVSGVKVAESESMLVLADNQGRQHQIAKDAIEEQEISSLSTMPEGLEKRITEDEFVNLIEYLSSVKESQAP
jgi:putative heme-binding domain-containing protein